VELTHALICRAYFRAMAATFRLKPARHSNDRGHLLTLLLRRSPHRFIRQAEASFRRMAVVALRMLSPLRMRHCAFCARPSRMAAAIVGSPLISCQCSTDIWLAPWLTHKHCEAVLTYYAERQFRHPFGDYTYLWKCAK
jgi:hypothetical protein